ncbi:LLM class flavin-dependent oxidoreductase [Rhodococcus hoagii]|nr:LLM class flavin-dependent oxidoreductase [Prescottella equi]
MGVDLGLRPLPHRPGAHDEATHEAWSLMAAFAAVTERVRLGQMCTAMSYRNPAYLAKVAATTDLISGGRVEMGIGGGWYEHEWRAYGYGFPSAGERLGRLDEVSRSCGRPWSTGAATLDGKHYQGTARSSAPCHCRTAASRCGSPVAAREGDVEDRGQVRAVHELRRHPRGVRAQVGDPAAPLRGGRHRLRRHHPVGELQRRDRPHRGRGTGPPRGAAGEARTGRRSRQGRGVAERIPWATAVGTPEQIVENLTALKKQGLEYAIFYVPEAAYDTSGLELLEKEVLPHLM